MMENLLDQVMGDILTNLIVSIIFFFVGLFLEKKFKITLWVQKIYHSNHACQFSFTVNLSGDREEIKQAVYRELANYGYKLKFLEKQNYRVILEAAKENLETLQLTIIAENPVQISISPVQTVVKKVSSRLSELTSILQKVKDNSTSNIESASLIVVLPYTPGIDITVPKSMKINNFQIEILNTDVKVYLSMGNKVSLHSTDFIQLAETYRMLV